MVTEEIIQPNDLLISTDTAFRQLNQQACPQAFMTKSQLFQTDERKHQATITHVRTKL